MADETIAANKLHKTDIVVGGEKDIAALYTEIYDVNGADISAGLAVTVEGETSPDIDLLAADEAVEGIVLDYANVGDYKSGYSLGVTIADNKKAAVLRPTGGRVKVQAVLSRSTTTAAAVAQMDPLWFEAGGKVTATAPATQGLDVKMYAGRLAYPVASGTADKVILMWY